MQSWSHLGASALILANMVSGLNIKVDAKAGKSCEYTAPWQTIPELPPMPKANFEGTAPIDGIDLCRPLTYDLMTEDVIGLMDHLGIDKFSTVGWSDGACISFDLAMNFTSRLDRSFAFGGTYSPENINATAAESPVFLEYMERVQEEYRKNSPSKGSLHDFEERMNTMWGSLPDWDAKSFAKIPTRYSDPNAPIIWIVDGDSEEAVTRSTPGEIHSWIWGSDLVVLPGVSHFTFMQYPETFNVMVQRFLEMPRFPGEL
ncbi:hypothetical protein FOXG_02739 [Fusarium oxysporum f. sp. lycopersici 4287]|uniref:AB hydrolase-1 domain-containing protein n=2 Tax=Fusarium oxysporum TaxID=5507 RepID=A0A0J9UG39_FUSO4|nr:hypothetical protein FOXG_02739 [Fusarium oxysporum f. sp. lycopersici 4287]KNA98373.1 hypothetical protein FOXG_02739 [Fusarium oxysporum f. sp. lycopersici 4287]